MLHFFSESFKLREFLPSSFFVFEAGREKLDAVGSEREIPGTLVHFFWQIGLRGRVTAWNPHPSKTKCSASWRSTQCLAWPSPWQPSHYAS